MSNSLKMLKRLDSFDKRNPPKFIENQNLQNILNAKLQDEAKQLAIKQKYNVYRLLILIDVSIFGKDGTDYINYINDTSPASTYDIVKFSGDNTLPQVFKYNYNLGYRCFLTCSTGSFGLANYCVPFFQNNQDTILFSTNSTKFFDEGFLPYNIIRLSVNDKDTTKYIVSKILYNYNTLISQNSSLEQLYQPISSNNIQNNSNTYDLSPVFSKVVYIYTEKDEFGNYDTYALGYKEQLTEAINSENNLITLESFMITDDNFVLPQRLKDLLSENPVSNKGFKNSLKTMFIINTVSPKKILTLFNELYMYDNYFIFGDSFSTKHFTSKYSFNYAIIPIGNFSYEGYKICGLISKTRGYYFSPFLYSISDITLKFIPQYKKMVSLNQNMKTIINTLKKIEFIVHNNYWYERKIFTYYVGKNPNNPTDITNAFYNYYIFFEYKFNPLTIGTFETQSDIEIIIDNDSNEPNSISLFEFGWNSRNSVVQDLLKDIPISFNFYNNSMIKDWLLKLEESIGGSRNNSYVNGYKNHTPLYFELWRSHDAHFSIMTVDIDYNIVMEYFVQKNYNINQTIKINRNCYKDAGINNDVPIDNLLYDETEDITIDFDTGEINGQNLTNYTIMMYFKGNRYKKSFNGLSTDYLAPLIINVNIIPTFIYTKYKIDDFVYCLNNDILGRVISVNNNYQDITIQPYLTITEDTSFSHSVIKNFDAQPILSNQINTKLYSNLDNSKLVDYTNWSVFRKNMFIRSIFMNTIINDDSIEINSITFNNFVENLIATIYQPIKETVSFTFSTYNNWLIWKNKMNDSKNNNNLQSRLFWEMCRSNSLEIVEKTIELNIIMNNNESKIYKINEYVDIERKIYSDFNTYDSSETILLPIIFSTTDIKPVDIIDKPIIYLQYFIGNEYKTNFNGITESYYSPVLININIVPIIIYTEYKINDYVILKDSDGNITSQIGRVLSIYNNNTIIEVEYYNTVLNETDTIYVKSSRTVLNVGQNNIILFNNNQTIINLDIIGNIKSGNNIDSLKIKSIIIQDSLFNSNSIHFDYFNTLYNDIIIENEVNDFFLTFSNLSSFNNFKNSINNEVFKLTRHTPVFFELWMQQSNLIKPINVNINYELIMNDLVPNIYTINETINLNREIIDINNNTIGTENFSINIIFNTENIMPSDILNSNLIYVNYFNGNKYLKFNKITNFYSPIIVSINILPISISDTFKINDFVICDKQICKIIDINNNFKNIQLKYYSITKIDKNNNNIYIIQTLLNKIVSSNIILPYKKYYEMNIIDKSEWGAFDTYNFIKINDMINTDIILKDSISFGNTTLQNFNSNKEVFDGIKHNFNITMLNETIFINFKKFVNSSITFDNFNHTPLFFEIYRSHSTLINPLLLEIDYNLKMSQSSAIYQIVKQISFIRNVYDNIGIYISNVNLVSTENDNIIIDITTPLITSNDILNNPIIFVKYFKGHKYINSFTNINEYYYSPIVVKIKIIPYLENTKVELLDINV